VVSATKDYNLRHHNEKLTINLASLKKSRRRKTRENEMGFAVAAYPIYWCKKMQLVKQF
jgi:hypothetical protein